MHTCHTCTRVRVWTHGCIDRDGCSCATASTRTSSSRALDASAIWRMPGMPKDAPPTENARYDRAIQCARYAPCQVCSSRMPGLLARLRTRVMLTRFSEPGMPQQNARYARTDSACSFFAQSTSRPNLSVFAQVGSYKFGSCEQAAYRKNVDFEGSDLVKGGYKVGGPAECCEKCAAHKSCHFWTYSTSASKCWVKASSSGEEKQPSRWSGYKEQTVTTGNVQFSPCDPKYQLTNTDFHGADIVKGGYADVPSASACCTKCINHGSCRFWTYSTDRKKCWIKSSSNGKEKQANRVSGVMPSAKPATCPTKGTLAPTPVEKPPCQAQRFAIDSDMMHRQRPLSLGSSGI